MPDLDALAAQFRRDVLAREARASRLLVAGYADAWRAIAADLDRLGAQIDAARRAGEDVSRAWLYRQERLGTLLRQVEAEIGQFAASAGPAITAAQAEAAALAQEHADGLVRAQLPPAARLTATFGGLHAGATQALVGALGDGSPLSDLLGELGPEAAATIRRTLITGVARGQGTQQIARAIRGDVGGSLVRAVTISRTEVLRSYRTAALQTYQANSDVVQGWVWHSALGARTCGFCWSMHGSKHDLEELFASHPRCRCSAIPYTKTWAELGFPGVQETRVEVEPGADQFARLPAEQQRAILGPAKHAAYTAGRLTLDDLRGTTRDGRWGRVGYERSLADILGEQDARRFRRAA